MYFKKSCYAVIFGGIHTFMDENNTPNGWQNIPEDKFEMPLHDLEVFKRIIDALPYALVIYTANGTTVYANTACIRLYKANIDGVIGKFNIFNDPTVDPSMPYKEIMRVLKGETVFFPAVKVPLAALSTRDNVEYDMDALYIDMTFFPVMEGSRVTYIVQHQVPCKVYRGRKEIEKAKEYIDNNWFEKFSLNGILAASGLSKTHFARLFKLHTGTTAHEYYIRVKIEKLKEKLTDPNITVSQAFHGCNLDYNGHFAGIFRDRVGVSPSEYKHSVSDVNSK